MHIDYLEASCGDLLSLHPFPPCPHSHPSLLFARQDRVAIAADNLHSPTSQEDSSEKDKLYEETCGLFVFLSPGQGSWDAFGNIRRLVVTSGGELLLYWC